MEGIRVKSKPMGRAKRYGSWEHESSDEWQLATGRMNHHSFQLEDWIPYSYLDTPEDEEILRAIF